MAHFYSTGSEIVYTLLSSFVLSLTNVENYGSALSEQNISLILFIVFDVFISPSLHLDISRVRSQQQLPKILVHHLS